MNVCQYFNVINVTKYLDLIISMSVILVRVICVKCSDFDA